LQRTSSALLLHFIFSYFWMASCNYDKPRKVAEYWVLLWYQEWWYQESFSISGGIGAAFLSKPDLILDVMLFSFEQLPFLQSNEIYDISSCQLTQQGFQCILVFQVRLRAACWHHLLESSVSSKMFLCNIMVALSAGLCLIQGSSSLCH
jgi:hypothetical protein